MDHSDSRYRRSILDTTSKTWLGEETHVSEQAKNYLEGISFESLPEDRCVLKKGELADDLLMFGKSAVLKTFFFLYEN
jgi:hypothetical protein